MIRDNHGRQISYLRLAVTDRCNLRCFYCMPEHGLDWLSREALMSDAELLRICALLVERGITKIRITGGEPFVRKDLMPLLTAISRLRGLEELSITTNGVLTAPFVPQLKDLGVKSVNLSLDTLDPGRFFAITRRDEFSSVMKTMEELLKYGISVKINTVVMESKNTEDIVPLAGLTKALPVSVRFIEEMPFNGNGHPFSGITWNYSRILDEIKQAFTAIQRLPDASFTTADHYQVPGHLGTIGLIAAYSRTFCGTCNRIRLTPQGDLMTCLYGNSALNIKDAMRKNFTDAQLWQSLSDAFAQREKDGFEAERQQKETPHESMAAIGG